MRTVTNAITCPTRPIVLASRKGIRMAEHPVVQEYVRMYEDIVHYKENLSKLFMDKGLSYNIEVQIDFTCQNKIWSNRHSLTEMQFYRLAFWYHIHLPGPNFDDSKYNKNMINLMKRMKQLNISVYIEHLRSNNCLFLRDDIVRLGAGGDPSSVIGWRGTGTTPAGEDEEECLSWYVYTMVCVYHGMCTPWCVHDGVCMYIMVCMVCAHHAMYISSYKGMCTWYVYIMYVYIMVCIHDVVCKKDQHFWNNDIS